MKSFINCQLTPDHLSELLDEVLINSTYRANAQRMQRKIVEANGLSVAADLAEEALECRGKAERAVSDEEL
jgi:UDP:flavonoid glycosyltransferase YjiC (YdhE family)